MLHIKETNSICKISKVDYKGAKAIVHLNIQAISETVPAKAVLIGFKDIGDEVFQSAFPVSSEEDIFESVVFWINHSDIKTHTNKDIGIDNTIQIPVDLSSGVYKNNHLYRNVIITIVDYADVKKILWSSEELHLCSRPLEFNIVGSIKPEFTKCHDTNTYDLSIKYSFKETSWLFDIQKEELTLAISVTAKQSTEFSEESITVFETEGSWEHITTMLEQHAHVTITAELKFHNIILWSDKLICVPGELSTLYVKKDQAIHIVNHKSALDNNLSRDIHVYHGFEEPQELALLIRPWKNNSGFHRKTERGYPLYTIEPFIKHINGSYIPLNKFYPIPLTISKVSWNNGTLDLDTCYNLTQNLSEDFPAIIYYNYSSEDAEKILSRAVLYDNFKLDITIPGIEVTIQGIEAVKYPILVIDECPEGYELGAHVDIGLFTGDAPETYTAGEELLIDDTYNLRVSG